MSTPESDFKVRLRQYLDDRGIYYTNIPGGFGVAPGAPDMVLCVGGLFVAFESKTHRGRLSDDQLIQKKKIEANGGIYCVTRTLEDAEEIISCISELYSGSDA